MNLTTTKSRVTKLTTKLTTKLVIISDTHNKHNQIELPEGDILIHAGDATSVGKEHEVTRFAEWFGKQDFEYKIFIAGNHDFLFEKENHVAREIMKNNGVIYLEDSYTLIPIGTGSLENNSYVEDNFSKKDFLKVYGSPHTPYFHNWAFNVHRGPELKSKWDLIPDDTDILITHGPPRGVLDKVGQFRADGSVNLLGGIEVGCEDLANRVKEIKTSNHNSNNDLQLHIFGHIHEGYGSLTEDGVTYINASMCDETYQANREAITYEL